MIGTLCWEVFDRVLIVNEHHLRRVLIEYLRHYNAAWPHRALGQLTPAQAGTRPPELVDLSEHRIRLKQVLGELTHEYYIAALPPTPLRKTQVTTPNHIFEPYKARMTALHAVPLDDPEQTGLARILASRGGQSRFRARLTGR